MQNIVYVAIVNLRNIATNFHVHKRMYEMLISVLSNKQKVNQIPRNGDQFHDKYKLIQFTYYFAESFNWYSLLREKHSWTPPSDHNLFMAANSSSENGSVSCIRCTTSNTIFASP